MTSCDIIVCDTCIIIALYNDFPFCNPTTRKWPIDRHPTLPDNANAERGERRRLLPKIRFPEFSAWECHCIRRKSCLAVGPTHQTPDMERYWYWAYVVYISINLNPTSQVTLTAFWCLEAWWFGSAQLVSRELLLQWKNNRGFSNSSSADGLDVGAKDINMQHIYILYDRSLGPDNWRFLSSRFLKLFMLKSQNTTDFSHQQVVFSSVFSSRLGLGRFSDCQLSLWLHPECHGSWGPWAPGLTTWKLVAPCEYMQMLGEHL